MTDERPIKDISELAEKEPSSSISLGAILTLLGLGLLIIFVVQNTETRSVEFLTWTVELPMWLLGVAFFVIGWISGYFVKTRRVKRKKREAAAQAG